MIHLQSGEVLVYDHVSFKARKYACTVKDKMVFQKEAEPGIVGSSLVLNSKQFEDFVRLGSCMLQNAPGLY